MLTLTNLLALFAFSLFVISQWNTEKRKKLKRILAFSITFSVFVVTIIKGCNDTSNAKLYSKRQDSIIMLHSEIGKLQDTLETTKDTLIKIGLGIDEKTGRLLVLDSQLLKKEFTKVFNINYNYVTNVQPTELTKYEEFTGTTSMTIKLAHVPIEGTERYTLNGIVWRKENWGRVGNTVTFKNFAIEKDDVITATYSYKK